MKKVFVIALALVLVLSMAACGSAAASNAPAEEAVSAASAVSAPEAEAPAQDAPAAPAEEASDASADEEAAPAEEKTMSYDGEWYDGILASIGLPAGWSITNDSSDDAGSDILLCLCADDGSAGIVIEYSVSGTANSDPKSTLEATQNLASDEATKPASDEIVEPEVMETEIGGYGFCYAQYSSWATPEQELRHYRCFSEKRPGDKIYPDMDYELQSIDITISCDEGTPDFAFTDQILASITFNLDETFIPTK